MFFSTCLPKISYDRYNERVFGYYNHYNRKGFLSAVINAEGTLSYVYSGPFGENGEIIYLQYNEGNGIWKPFNAPTPDCLSCDINKMIGILYSSELGHLVLDVAGMVPVFGEAFDVLNGVWYTIEGDGDMATISFASTIPLVYATTIKNVGRIIKLSDGTFAAIKLNAEASKTLITTLKKANLSADVLEALLKDLQNPTFAKALAENPRLIDSWKHLKPHHPDLAKDVEALSALSTASTNKNVADLGVTAEDLAKVQGYGTTASKASFIDIVNDINKMADNLKANNIQIENLDIIISKLQQTDKVANDTRKGFHFIIKDLGSDVKTFNGKKVKLEHSIPNARPTTGSSSIDLFCLNCSPANLKVEYKSGPSSINSKTIKEQFVERDLFNANSLDEIQWRMEGTEFTKDKLVQWMSENKTSIENLGYDKIKKFYPNDEFMNTTNYVDRFVNKFADETTYKTIFR